jgi:hypothetical protein
MSDVVDFLPQDAVAFLRLADGESRFPVRPIREGDFLVGSGMDCDLRLGDGVLPPLHSVLRVTQNRASWTRLVRHPELVVNGESVQQAEVNDGDVVEIGPFRMLFRFAEAQSENALQTLLAADAGFIRPEHMSGMSAPQIVDALQSEIAILNTFNRTAQDALAELISAADRLAETTSRAGSASLTSAADSLSHRPQSEDDLLRVIQAQADRIETISEVLEHVVRQQRVMTDVLHGLTGRIAEFASATTPNVRRASA